jgi:ABC-2 type transport system ATP-binding protein
MDIHIGNISKKFNNRVVLRIPELSITDREIIGIAGNNGAGKSTLFKLCLNLLKADTGAILIDKNDVSKTELWKESVSSYIDENFLIDFLLPEEYFYFIGSFFNLSKNEINERLLNYQTFMNDEILNNSKYIRNFSSGNRQKIGIIGAMITNPQLLILDEPFNFLDPTSQIEIKRLIKNMNEQFGTIVLISSHNIYHLVDISTRVIILDKGSIIKDINNMNDNALIELNNHFNLH